MTRAEFEADYFVGIPEGVPGRERSGDGYKYSAVQFAWSMWKSAWQASRAQAIKPAAEAAADAAIRYANGHVVDFEEEMRRALGDER